MVPANSAQLAASLRIPGLALRAFKGEGDYEPMGDVLRGSWDADHVEWTVTADDYRLQDERPINHDPYNDRLMAEIDGELVGFCEISWWQETNGPRLYKPYVHVVPERRRTEIRRALLRWGEARLKEIADQHPPELQKQYDTWANDEKNDWKSLLLSEGYRAAHHSLEMVRRDLEDIPDPRLPEGLLIRPVMPEDIRPIWELAKEAMRDHRNYSEDGYDEAHLQKFLREPICDPNLWAVAWAGDRPVGVVMTYINGAENEQYGRKRGHTENIAVAREWRGNGIASALVARSLQTLKECGMTSATLDVDAQNPTGALKVYKRIGFEVVKSFTFYRKPLA